MINTAKETIKKHYVIEKGVDKFTKIAEYEMSYPGLTLESEQITDFVQNKDFYAHKMAEVTGLKLKGSGNSKLSATFIYRRKDVLDFLILKLELNIYSLWLEENETIIKGAQIYFLLDGTETLDCGKSKNYKVGEGAYEFGLVETIILELDFAFLAKMAIAKKIEYRVIGRKGNISEGEFNKSDVFKIKGFYNGLFDSEYMLDELLIQMEIDIVEEQKKHMEEIREEEEAKKKIEEIKQNNLPKTEAKSTPSGCFVITATMGDPYHPIVDEFRTFRDQKLLTNKFGIAFVNFYYKVGPHAALIISKNEFLRKLTFSFFVYPIYKQIKKI
jgi:hypothetical protein